MIFRLLGDQPSAFRPRPDDRTDIMSRLPEPWNVERYGPEQIEYAQSRRLPFASAVCLGGQVTGTFWNVDYACLPRYIMHADAPRLRCFNDRARVLVTVFVWPSNVPRTRRTMKREGFLQPDAEHLI